MVNDKKQSSMIADTTLVNKTTTTDLSKTLKNCSVILRRLNDTTVSSMSRQTLNKTAETTVIEQNETRNRKSSLNNSKISNSNLKIFFYKLLNLKKKI